MSRREETDAAAKKPESAESADVVELPVPEAEPFDVPDKSETKTEIATEKANAAADAD